MALFLAKISFAQKGELNEYSYQCADGKQRPFVLYTPQNSDKAKLPLLVFLHGAVSSPQLKNALDYARKSPFLKMADEAEFAILFPYGNKGAGWFDEVGSAMVLGEIAEAQKKIKIDKDKIFLSGFSDGGSGVQLFSVLFPDSFAGFISLNGSFKIAEKLSAQSLFPENMNAKPMLIFNTTKDFLYPLSQMQPVADYLKTFNPNIEFITPEGAHDPSYLPQYEEKIINFIRSTTQSPQTALSWESNTENTGIGWIKIKKINTQEQPQDWHKPYSLRVFNNKADLGLLYDNTYKGKGLKVYGFKNERSEAPKMGVQIGDIILKMEEHEMSSTFSQMYYFATKQAGEPISLSIQRGDKTLTLNGKLNEGYYYQIFEKPVNSAKVKAHISGKTLIISTSKTSDIEIDYSQIPRKIKWVELNGKRLKATTKNTSITLN